MLFTGVIAVSGCLYIASKIYKKKQDKYSDEKEIEKSDENAQSGEIISKSDYETQIDQKIMLSIGLMGLTTGAALLSSPILTLLSIPGIIYLQIPFIKGGCYELFKKRKIGAATLDAIIALTMTGLRYFFASALFFTLYYTSRKILKKTEDSSKKILIDIWGETPNFVWIYQDGIEVEIPFAELQPGDIVIIHAGETIPVDGLIEKGMGNIDQHILTGEARPVEKGASDTVFASTVLLSGRLHIKVDKAGNETVAGKIKNILNNTTDFKSSMQARGEAMTEKAALPTLALSAVTLPILGAGSAATVLLASFGGQMRVVAPISVLNFLKIASEKGILIKDGRALEALQTIDTVVFDKTGTLTREQPCVGAIMTYNSQTENKILCYAAAAEYKQKHPIALAILEEAQNRKLDLPMIDEAGYEVGYGLKVRLDDKLIRVGSARFMEIEHIDIPENFRQFQTKSHEQGISLVYVAINEQLGGAIELQTTIRPESFDVISNLQKRGMNTVIISGDHEEPTRKLSEKLSIKQYFAETLPENKAELIEKMQKNGRKVCFVGDGINDSIALKKANVSISLRGASTIATDTAQIILMDESLKQLTYLFDLADRLDKNLRVNFITALIPGLMCVGGVYLFHLGVIAAGIMYNVSLGVGVGNAMLPKLKNNLASRKDEAIKQEKQ